MKKLLLLSPLVFVAACGSSRGPGPDSGSDTMVYLSSARTTSDIARCLDSRLSRVHASTSNGSTELTVGSSSNGSYFITLTPSRGGTVVKVVRGASEDPPEEELRFAIARCTT
ncbi:sugar ABC transporter ATPase [Paraburkholderia humisilvae]|uniref:Sugar ABC transporter ATPase n=1 Tax=Paraburkholderia humisilvae TaxID=627669 RepID=A0A6J5EAR2_9BURK|nr:sugar ABC transporter ATPase [Paraburkholderia humisilvae]CAB3762947.1 hypothetical protein LMG29542_04463 [Paraburkholderia humisilvae]